MKRMIRNNLTYALARYALPGADVAQDVQQNQIESNSATQPVLPESGEAK